MVLGIKSKKKVLAYIGRDKYNGIWLVTQAGAGSLYHYVMTACSTSPTDVVDSIKPISKDFEVPASL